MLRRFGLVLLSGMLLAALSMSITEVQAQVPDPITKEAGKRALLYCLRRGAVAAAPLPGAGQIVTATAFTCGLLYQLNPIGNAIDCYYYYCVEDRDPLDKDDTSSTGDQGGSTGGEHDTGGDSDDQPTLPEPPSPQPEPTPGSEDQTLPEPKPEPSPGTSGDPQPSCPSPSEDQDGLVWLPLPNGQWIGFWQLPGGETCRFIIEGTPDNWKYILQPALPVKGGEPIIWPAPNLPPGFSQE